MPKLPTPQSNPTLPGKIFTSETQGAAIGAGLEDLGGSVTQLGQALAQRKAQREISALNAEFAAAQAELTVEWQETLRTADPSDLDTADRFREGSVATRLASLEQKATSREAKDYFSRLSAGLSSSFLVTTEAGMASLAETAAVDSFNTFKNQFANAVTADPYSFEDVLPNIDMAIEGYVQTNNLSREQAIKLRSEAASNTAMSAAMARVEANPDEGIEFIDAGGYSEYLDPRQNARLKSYGETIKRSQEAAREKAIQQRLDAKRSNALAAVIAPDGSVDQDALLQVSAQLARDPDFQSDPAGQAAAFNLIRGLQADAEDSRANKTNPQLMQSFVQRALLPRGNPNRATITEVQERIANGITAADANHIINIIQGQEDPATKAFYEAQDGAFRAGRSVIAGSSDLALVSNPAAIIDYQNFENWARARSLQLFKEGMSPTDVFATDGPIYSEMPSFMRSRDGKKQISEFRDDLAAGRAQIRTAPGVTLEVDPFAIPDDTSAKPVSQQTVEDMDAFLRDN